MGVFHVFKIVQMVPNRNVTMSIKSSMLDPFDILFRAKTEQRDCN